MDYQSCQRKDTLTKFCPIVSARQTSKVTDSELTCLPSPSPPLTATEAKDEKAALPHVSTKPSNKRTRRGCRSGKQCAARQNNKRKHEETLTTQTQVSTEQRSTIQKKKNYNNNRKRKQNSNDKILPIANEQISQMNPPEKKLKIVTSVGDKLFSNFLNAITAGKEKQSHDLLTQEQSNPASICGSAPSSHKSPGSQQPTSDRRASHSELDDDVFQSQVIY